MRALILSRDSRHLGGVVNFVDLLTARLSAQVQVTRFRVGARWQGREAPSRPWQPFLDAVRLIGTVRRDAYDLVHINPSLNGKALARDGLFLLALRLIGQRNLLVFIHGWDERFARRVRAHRLLRAVLRGLLGRGAQIVVLASRFKAFLYDLGIDPGRIHVLTTMFDGEIFTGLERNPEKRGMTALFMGRLVREKGIYEVLEAFARIAPHFPDLKLEIAGDGPERPALAAWVACERLQERVRLLGYVRAEHKAQVLLDADLFVFPTFHGEGCPVALLEAMAAGLGVITTARGGIPDVFEDGVNGILLEEVSGTTLAAALERLLCDRAFLERVQENNRRKAWQAYEAGSVTRRMEAIYAMTIGQGGGNG